MDKYKNKKFNMSLHVPESLFEHYLYENAQDAEKIFQDASIGPEDSLYKNFFSTFSDVPEYMGKFAEWTIYNEDIEPLEDIYFLVKQLKSKNIPIDEDISKFRSIFQFKKYLEGKIKARDKDEDTIKKWGLIPIQGNRGMYRTPDVDNYSQREIKGQGLYIWTDLSELYDGHGSLSKLKAKFKFGQFGKASESGKTAVETISGYSGTYLGPKVILYIQNLNNYIKNPNSAYNNSLDAEKAVQKSLEGTNWSNLENLKSTEVFRGGSLEELIKIINETLKGSSRSELIPREEQTFGIDKITEYFEKSPDNKEFLLAAKMRYGKNITILRAIKNLSDRSDIFKNVLFISYKPSVFSSLKEDISKFSDFEDFEIVDISTEEEEIPETSLKSRIFISSAQYVLYKNKINESKAEENLNELTPEEEVETLQKSAYSDYEINLKKIKNIHFGLLVADEYHYGTKSEKFRGLLEKIKPDRIIWVSGTAMKDMATGKFDQNQMYNWTYIDEQKKKEKEKDLEKTKPGGYYPHLQMPTMNFMKMKLGEDALELARDKGLYSDDQGFSFTKLIKTENGKLKNQELAKQLIHQILDPKYSDDSINGATNVHANLDHMFWVLPKDVDGIKAFAKLLEKEYGDEYDIIPATGNLNHSIDKVKNKIKEAEKKGKKSIVLSCYRFKEGTTVPEWESVVMLDDGKSPEEYLQAIFRCQSPGRKGQDKDNCYVFDYNPERLMSLYHDIAQWNSKDGKEPQSKLVEDFLKYAPILQSNGNEMVPIDANEVIEHFRTSGSFSEKMANERVFNYQNLENALDEGFLENLRNISPKKKATNIILNTHNLAKYKNAILSRIERENTDLSNEEIEKIADLEIVKEKIRNVLRTIPTFLFVTPENEKTIYEIRDTKDPSLFHNITGVDPDFIGFLLKNKILNDKIINQTIEFISDSIENLQINPTLEGAEYFIKKNLVMAGTESSTPNSVVNEMLDKLPEDIWSNPKSTFCDPVCGTGKFLMGVLERLMKGLEFEIPNEGERREHILENQIYGNDKEKYKTLITKKLLGTSENNEHIMNKDSLDSKTWKNMKFDVVIGNPPYQTGLHLKFLDLSYDISNKFVIFIQPSIWVLSDTYKAGIKVKEKIKDHIKSIELINGNPIFNIASFVSLSITEIDKSRKFNKIIIQDKINHKETELEDINDINKWSDYNTYPVLEDKIKKLAGSKNFLNTKNRWDKNAKYFINLPMNRGVTSTKPNEKFWTDIFYSPFPRDTKVLNEMPEKWLHLKQKNWYGFNDLNEAQNCLDFLKSRWGMFCFSIGKDAQYITEKVARFIPWLDWSNPWSAEMFEKEINATPEEIDFVKENIPDFYGTE